MFWLEMANVKLLSIQILGIRPKKVSNLGGILTKPLKSLSS